MHRQADPLSEESSQNHLLYGILSWTNDGLAFPVRPAFGETDQLSKQILQYLEEEVFRTIYPPEQTAGIIVEGIQSDGGLILPPDDFLPGLQELCKRHDISLIFDEVKVGLGRTGKWFSFDHYQLTPDAVVLGKSLGAGLPISAVVARAELLDVGSGIHMFTTNGNPVSSCAALENLHIIEEESLIHQAGENGAYFINLMNLSHLRLEMGVSYQPYR